MNFLPFIGNTYQKQDFKILILGESHHMKEEGVRAFQIDPLKHKNKTTDVIESFLGYKNREIGFLSWMNTFTRFTNIFNNRTVELLENDQFWNRLSFYNYVQTPVDEARKSPTKEQFIKSHQNFATLIDDLIPNLIIVWGYRLWNNMPKNNVLYKKDDIDFYNNIPVLVVPHPASSKFDYSMHSFINQYIDKINEYQKLQINK